MQEQIAQLSEAYRTATVALIAEIRRHELVLLEHAHDAQEPPDVVQPYRTGSGNFWIALVDGSVIGTVGLVDLGGGQGCLQKMYVHPDFRGTGTALRLLNTLIGWADSRRIRELYLGTFYENRGARRFYEKQGFSRVSEAAVPTECPRSNLENCFYRYSMASQHADSVSTCTEKTPRTTL